MSTQDSATHGVSAADLAAVARTRVFFGHQSVGMNVLNSVPDVYAVCGMARPAIGPGGPPGADEGGFLCHDWIGENGKPLLKIADFDAKLRGGIAAQVDVAMMKFCYVDVGEGTDIGALFATYRRTFDALERDFPAVAFVHVTVPLTAEPGLRSKLKSRLTGRSPAVADNAARQRLNALIRDEYRQDRRFDLAAVESTAPDGRRVGGTHQGQRYFALHEGYAADFGHLNAAGARVAAAAWLTAIARARGQ